MVNEIKLWQLHEGKLQDMKGPLRRNTWRRIWHAIRPPCSGCDGSRSAASDNNGLALRGVVTPPAEPPLLPGIVLGRIGGGCSMTQWKPGETQS